MLHFSNFDDVACITTGIAITNPCLVNRIRKQATDLSDYEIAAHLANAIASATDAGHSLAWEASQYGESSAETQVDHEYFEELAAAWSMIAIEHQIDSFDVLYAEDASIH